MDRGIEEWMEMWMDQCLIDGQIDDGWIAGCIEDGWMMD